MTGGGELPFEFDYVFVEYSGLSRTDFLVVLQNAGVKWFSIKKIFDIRLRKLCLGE